jgi:hypothetical protein
MATVGSFTAVFNNTSGSHSVTGTPAVGDLIVIFTGDSANTTAVAPTDNNADGLGTYSFVVSAVTNTSTDGIGCWVRNAAIGSATSTVFTHNPGTNAGGGLLVCNVAGMKRVNTGAIRQSASQNNQGNGTTPTPTFGSAALTANPVISALVNQSNVAGVTIRGTPAYTSLANVGYLTPTLGFEAMSINSGETASAIAWGGTSATGFASLAIELDTSSDFVLEDPPWDDGDITVAPTPDDYQQSNYLSQTFDEAPPEDFAEDPWEAWQFDSTVGLNNLPRLVEDPFWEDFTEDAWEAWQSEYVTLLNNPPLPIDADTFWEDFSEDPWETWQSEAVLVANVAVAANQPPEELPWEDFAGDDDIFAIIDDDDDAVSTDNPPLPIDADSFWDDSAEDTFEGWADDSQIGADNPHRLVEDAFADDYGEDAWPEWADDSGTVGADNPALPIDEQFPADDVEDGWEAWTDDFTPVVVVVSTDQPQADEPWEDAVSDGPQPDDYQQSDNLPQPIEEAFSDDYVEDYWESQDDSAPVVPDSIVQQQPVEDAVWDDAAEDAWETLDEVLGANAVVAQAQPPAEDWQDDYAEDEWGIDEPIGAENPPALVEDAFADDSVEDFWETQDDSAPVIPDAVAPQQQQIEDGWPWEDQEPENVTVSSDYQQSDGAIVGSPDISESESFLFDGDEDLSDYQVEDFSQIDEEQAIGDDWAPDEDVLDDWETTLSDGVIGLDFIPPPNPVEDAFWDDSAEDTSESWADDSRVGADNPPALVEDAFWEDYAEDSWPEWADESAPVGPDSVALIVEDAWAWNEEEGPPDDWFPHLPYEVVVPDRIPDPIQFYEEPWDWQSDTVEDAYEVWVDSWMLSDNAPIIVGWNRIEASIWSATGNNVHGRTG